MPNNPTNKGSINKVFIQKFLMEVWRRIPPLPEANGDLGVVLPALNNFSIIIIMQFKGYFGLRFAF